jgi:hypothetical protein
MAENRENTKKINAAATSSNYSEKRSGKERRVRKLPMLKYIFLPGRRHKTRRHEDSSKFFFFDRYSSKLFAAIVLILLLSILDALLTLYLIQHGFLEINPVMAYFLEFGPFAFMGAKYFLTSFGMVILLICKNVFFSKPNFQTELLFSYVIIAFSTVILWELYLVLFMVA